jgi:hypothetical protein
MSSVSIPAVSPASAREPNFAVLMGAAWLLVVAQLMAQNWSALAVTLPDADDAMRLVQVRDFLAGHGWFDLHTARLNPPWGYDSHWSRLIDAGLAGLFLIFNHFVDASLAERLMSAVWPVLWLLPSIGAVAAVAWRLGGRDAAVIVLLLAAFAIPGFQQFRPGRIDHHNIHIALTLLATAAAAWSDRLRWCAWATGGLTGLAAAIGFEALPFYALFGALFALRFIVDRETAGDLRAYALALSASTLGAFLVTVGPDHWTTSACDMIAINSTAAVIVASAGLIVAARYFAGERPWRERLLACGACAATALAVFVAFEPRCLAGPFGLIDPAIRPIWLDNVSEAQPLSRILRESPVTAMAMASFPAVAMLALLLVGGNSTRRRDFGFLLAGATFILAVVAMLAAVRVYSYAIWLGLPLVAAAAAQVFAKLKSKSLLPRFAMLLLVTPTAVTMGTIVIAQATSKADLLDLNSPERQACVAKENYAPIARLPVGLVVVNALEWAPYLLAWTPQPVLAAPYHRMSAGIISSHQALAFPPREAHGVITRVGVRYVAICGAHAPEGMSAASLWGSLQTGAIPDWLERLPESREGAFVIYRVKN